VKIETESWGPIDFRGGILAPAAYFEAPESLRQQVCNGCGTAGWKGKIVPDTILGQRITGRCDPHDWMYHYGRTELDKVFADVIFLANLLLAVYIESKAPSWLRYWRSVRAVGYFIAVFLGGRSAFLAGRDGFWNE